MESNVDATRSSARGLTIQHKLMDLMLLMTIGIVGFLGVYFPARQIDALRVALAQKTRTYGALVAQEVRSAVAFDDVETARETFDAIALDPVVQSIVLFKADGTILHSYGSASQAAMAAAGGVREPAFSDLADHNATLWDYVGPCVPELRESFELAWL